MLAGGRPRRHAHVRAAVADRGPAAGGAPGRGGTHQPQIAEELFVTIKTVETHLGAVYRKLGIGTRDELAVALGGPRRDTTAAALP